MNTVFLAVAVARRDAGTEPTWTYSRRATARNTVFMSRIIVALLHGSIFNTS